MARKKTGGKNFEPGHEKTPGSGRPAVSPMIKEVQKLNAEKLVEMLNALIHLDKGQLAAKEQDPIASYFELIIISILKQAKAKGDHQRTNFILDRLVGKTKEQIEHTGDGFRIVIEDYLGKKEK